MRRDVQNLSRFYLVVVVLLFLAMLSRLAYLQLFSWNKYFAESERNRVRDVILDSPRGLVLDRHGEVLVDNSPMYSVSVVPYEFLKSDTTVTLLASILNGVPADMKQKIKREKISNFTPVRLKRQIGFRALSGLEELRRELPGVFYNVDSRRIYPSGVKAPHLFGYMGEITQQELAGLTENTYQSGDLIGKSGIELTYEKYLRGRKGVKYVEVDVLGREIRDLADLPGRLPDAGKNTYMTIDANIQRFLEKRMADLRGAAVVLDPRNGDVLAILSKPDYDPEIFSNPLTPEIWNSLINNDGGPLYSRSTQSLFPPGSTYKLVLAAAGLETGLLDIHEKITCTGSYRLGRRPFACWKKGGHGEVTLLTAIQGSCNVYFYKKSLDIGLANWSKFSRLFGFGEKTGIDLPNESPGLVPDKAYFDMKYGVRGWTRGLLLNLAVGQGDLLTTPLQMACFTMAIGNEGTAFRPRLVSRIEDAKTGRIVSLDKKTVQIDGVSAQSYQLMKEGMHMVVNAVGGTGRAARVDGADVCGKTGTAQNPHGDSHAWFIGFAPKDNPEIALCIFVENGGGGGAVAAPIAGGVLRLYFSEKKMPVTAPK